MKKGICSLCLNEGMDDEDDEKVESEMMKMYGDSLWVHFSCLRFASGLKRVKRSGNSGLYPSLKELEREIRRGKLNPCFTCEKIGATVNCNEIKCHRAFHLPCYYKTSSHSSSLQSNSIYCSAHFCPRHNNDDKNQDDDEEIKPIVRDLKAGLSQMKSLFCKDIDPHLKRLKIKKRSLERSPLSDNSTPGGTGSSNDLSNASDVILRRKSGKENSTNSSSKDLKKRTSGRRSLSLNKTEIRQMEMIKRPLERKNKLLSTSLPTIISPNKKRKRSAVKLFQLSDWDNFPAPVKILKRKSTDPNDLNDIELLSPPKLEVVQPPIQTTILEEPPNIQIADDKSRNYQNNKSKNRQKRNGNHLLPTTSKKIVFNEMKRAFKNSLIEKKSTKKKKNQIKPIQQSSNKIVIKAFRKSPVKFDSSRIISQDDDGIVSSLNSDFPSKTKITKKRVKDTSSTIRKLNFDIPFTPVNRLSKTVPGNYFSHGRQYYHVRTNGLISENCEPEAEEDYQWISNLMKRQIDEFLDLNNGEKEFFKLWNEYIILNPAFGNKMLEHRLKTFVECHGEQIVSSGLYRNFILHLTNLFEHELLDQANFFTIVLLMQRKMETSVKKPWFNSWTKSINSRKEENGEFLSIMQQKLPSNDVHLLNEHTVDEDLRLLRQFDYEVGRCSSPQTSQSSFKKDICEKSSLSSKSKRKHTKQSHLFKPSSVRSRRSLLKNNHDAQSKKVGVRYWGPGDYSSISDIINVKDEKEHTYTYSPIRYKRKAEESLSILSNNCDMKRRRIIRSPKLLDL